MRAAETQWWIIELPDEWQAEQDEETILIGDEDDVGEIAITTLEKEQGQANDVDLKDLSKELEKNGINGKSISIGDLAGYYYCYSEEGDAIREWYLKYENIILFITYICDQDNAGMDDGVVDDILSTLFMKKDKEEV